MYHFAGELFSFPIPLIKIIWVVVRDQRYYIYFLSMMKKKQTPDTKTDKLSSLKSQMKDMSQDYQDMIKAREQAKKQMEGRFNDVYSGIEQNKQFTLAEGARVMETLTAFQNKFENKLETAKDTIEKEILAEKKVLTEQLTKINTKLDSLDKTLADEKQERIKQTEETLAPVRKDLDRMFVYFSNPHC